jgi:hypothetical protein
MPELLGRRKQLAGAEAEIQTEPEKPAALPTEGPSPFGTIRGEVKYPWGAVTEARIKVQSTSVELASKPMDRDAVTDRAGKYEIPNVEAGSYNVVVEPPFPGYGGATRKAVVTAGQKSFVDFYLDYLKTLVHGYVYNKDGKPIAGATLSGVLCGKGTKSTLTDGTGYFKFDDATPGDLFVRVNAPGFMGETLDFEAKIGEKTKLEFHLAQGGCKVHGIISDFDGGPLSGEVILSSESGIILERTPSNADTGHYEFSVVPGTYNILAVVLGYQSEGWKGQVTADRKVDLRLAPMPEQNGDYTLGA